MRLAAQIALAVIGAAVVLFLVAVIVLAATLATGAAAQTASGIEVVDEDTVRFGGVSWRLRGYDTPEIYYAKCQAERQAGELATREQPP